MEVGEFTYGAENISVMSWDENSTIKIGRFCSIATNVRIFTGGNHNSNWISTYPFGHINQGVFGDHKQAGHPSSNGDVIIGNDVWIGFGVTIMSGVRVGDGAIIAANSHIVKNISDYELWGGNPATFIKKRFSDEEIELLLELKWWNYPESKVNQFKNILSSDISILKLHQIQKLLD